MAKMEEETEEELVTEDGFAGYDEREREFNIVIQGKSVNSL